MEQNEAFKGVVNLIQSLEQQLITCGESAKSIEQRAIEIEKEIDEHFGKCMNALAARKAELLSECAVLTKNHKKAIEETQVKIKDAIDGCTKALEAGSFFFKTDVKGSESIWKSTKNISTIRLEKAKLCARLPSSFVSDVQNYGKVTLTNCCDFLQIVEATTFVGPTSGQKEEDKFKSPENICFNPQDNFLYVCDFGNASLKRVSMQGSVETLASFKQRPYGIALTHNNNFVATFAHVVVSGSTYGIALLAGQVAGDCDDQGSLARFKAPRGVAIDPTTENIFVSERDNNKIRMVTPQGRVTTLAGSGERGFREGNRYNAKFNSPFGIAFDETTKTILVCDRDNNKLRRVSLNGDVSTVCEIQSPSAVVITLNGIIFVTSRAKNAIYIVTKQEQRGEYKVNLLEGVGELKGPVGISVDEFSRTCFVAENEGHSIKKITFL